MLHLSASFLCVARSSGALVFDRIGSTLVAENNARSVSFGGARRAVAAQVLDINNELCLGVLFNDLTLQYFALPGLQTLASLSFADRAGRFSAHLGIKNAGGYVDGTGRMIIFDSRAENSALWWAASRSDTCALDEALGVPAALLGQALMQLEGEIVQQTSAPQQKKSVGFLGGLFGGGAAKSLRDLVVPAAGKLAPEVEADSIDGRRRLAPAWRDPEAIAKKIAAQSAAQSERSREQTAQGAASSTKDVLQKTNQQAAENLEKTKDIADKSARLEQESANFLKMAKQLNEKQSNSWF